MKKITQLLMILIGIQVLFSCSQSQENKAAGSDDYVVGSYELNSFDYIRLANAPDGHQYIIYTSSGRGGIVHAEGCNNSTHITPRP